MSNSAQQPKSFCSNLSRRKSIMYRQKEQENKANSLRKRMYKVEFGASNPHLQMNLKYGNNTITTTKYNIITLLPKNLFFQFTRVSNIYFLVVSILTCLPFSPKEPISMIGTFIFVLFFSLCKDAIEDLGRYKQDRILNNKPIMKFHKTNFIQDKCRNIYPGDLIRVNKEQEFTCDVLLIHSSNEGGYLYIDTKNLDGETNLKEKCSIEDLRDFNMNETSFCKLKGIIETTISDANMFEWEGIMAYNEMSEIYCCMKNLVLKGSVLKNTNYVYGIVVYAGHQTKIMKNSKHPKPKTSKIIHTMNTLMYSLFGLTLIICIVFAIFSVNFINQYSEQYTYIYPQHITINTKKENGFLLFGKHFFIYFIAYAQIIPISLYVAMEIIKMYQVILVKYDNRIYDIELQKPATCRTSELIEELGQVDFIFSDKTGTLTQNVMVFKKCFINGKVYGANDDVSNDFEPRTINGDLTAYNLLSKTEMKDENEREDKKKVELFFKLLTLCHEVFPEKNKDNNIITYQGSSPDDIALVKGAQQLGYEFDSKEFNTITIKNHIINAVLQYELLALIPFDSDRQRMSVIVKEVSSSKIYLFSKGSDSVMLKGVSPILPIITKFKLNLRKDEFGIIINELNSISKDNSNISNIELFKIMKVLEFFSREGLRILVMGYKEIQTEEYEQWIKQRDEARKESEDKLKEVYAEIEKNLEFVGCSAIEDKLQEGVPETIEILLSCGIRIWVLTGDKQDTAEQISRQCRLIDNTMTLLNLTVEPGQKQLIQMKLSQSLQKYDLTQFVENKKIKLEQLSESSSILDDSEASSTINPIPQSKVCISVIIDGVSLEIILADKELSRMFFLLCAVAKSVICCRVTPKQKSAVVQLAKQNGDYVTLSIGDGANDVPMIMESSIGVGIQGKEGTQAVRAADYAIGQFRFLQELLLFYGRNGYIKISKYICYYFYKNIVLVVTELVLTFYNGFSGQIFFADWLGTMFNAIFTSWPCLFIFAYEKEHSVDICRRFPVLYKAGPKNVLFNLKVFWTYIFYGLLHSVLCFYFAVYGLRGYTNSQGITMNHWRVSTVSFSLVINVVSLKLMIISEFWNVLSIVFSICSVLFYYGILFALCTNAIGKVFQNELIGVAVDIFSNIKCVLIIVIGPVLICSIDVICKQMFYVFFPSPSEYLYKYRNHEDFKRYMTSNFYFDKMQRSVANSIIGNIPVAQIAGSISKNNTNKSLEYNEQYFKSKGKFNCSNVTELDNNTNYPLKGSVTNGNIIEELNKNKNIFKHVNISNSNNYNNNNNHYNTNICNEVLTKKDDDDYVDDAQFGDDLNTVVDYVHKNKKTNDKVMSCFDSNININNNHNNSNINLTKASNSNNNNHINDKKDLFYNKSDLLSKLNYKKMSIMPLIKNN